MTQFQLSTDSKTVRKYERGKVALFLLQDTDTPAMVELVTKDGSVFASYNCAVGESAVDGYELSKGQVDWLAEREGAVEKHFMKVRP
jgi:hypothetical protein